VGRQIRPSGSAKKQELERRQLIEPGKGKRKPTELS
jgi:hypothetical protein